MNDIKSWLADPESEHDPKKLADALEQWWLYPRMDSADFIRDVIFCLRHSAGERQRAEAAEAHVKVLEGVLKAAEPIVKAHANIAPWDAGSVAINQVVAQIRQALTQKENPE